MSLSGELCLSTVAKIETQLGLEETVSTPLYSAIDNSSVGCHRVLSQTGVASLVYVGMTVEAFGLDSHMCFAFTPSDSAVPHFTIDSVWAQPNYAFHLDLIPRVDPGAHLRYIDECYGPLSEMHAQVLAIEGLSRAHLSPRQWQLMSAWMLAHRAEENAFKEVFAAVEHYCDHWLSLLRNGVSPEALAGVSVADLDRRDQLNRAAIFNPDVDPVWHRIDQLLGPETSTTIRHSLQEAARN